MKPWPRSLRPAAAAGSLLALVMAAGAAGQGQIFTGRSDVVEVEVPVYAVKNGRPVRGLTAADFEIYDGKKKQRITGFEVVDLELGVGTGRPGGELPMAARRHFLVLFDLAYSRPESILKARTAAVDLVRNALHPSDLVAVATYSHSQGPRLVLSFTSDRNQVETAIASLGMHKLTGLQADPLGIVLTRVEGNLLSREISQGVPDVSPSGPASGDVDFESELQQYLESINQQRRRSDRRFDASRVAAMSRSMSDLGALLDAVEGRKHVVYLSEGFDSSLISGEAKTDEENRKIETGQYWDAGLDQTFGDSSLARDVEEMLEAFRRSDVVVHTVNVGGAAVVGADTQELEAANLAFTGGADLQSLGGSGRNSLLTIAAGTGGGFYDNFNDLQDAMGQLLSKTSVTYVLSFSPKNLAFDGAYHRLQVKLKGHPGVRLEHRPGYFAPKPAYQRGALERRLDTAELLLSDRDRGSLELSVLATPFPVEGEPAYVPVVIEVGGTSLLGDYAGSVLRTEIFAYANDAGGSFADFFTQFLELDVAKVEPLLAASGLRFVGHLDLPPGDFTLRVLVRNSGSGDYALRVRPLHVPAPLDDGPLLVASLVPEATDRWLTVREGDSQVAERDIPYVFTHGDETPYAPIVRPRLRPGIEVPLYLLGRNLAGAEIDGRVLAADGRPIGAAALALGERLGHVLGDQLAVRFATGGLTPGDYRLEITATDPASGRRSSSVVAFAIERPGDAAKGGAR